MADESKQFVGPGDNAADTTTIPNNPNPTPINPVIDESITADMFDKLISGDESTSVSKAVEETKQLTTTPVVEESKKGEEKIEEPKVEEVKKEEPKVETTKVPEKPIARDYSDIDEALVPVFKKMGNEFFNNLAPIAKANTALKKSLEATKAEADKFKKNAMPENYFAHPRGYTLTPDFEVAANTAIKAEQIVNHWETQLKRIDDGEDTYQELHINPQGELYLSGPVKADKESVTKLNKLVAGSQQQLAGVRNNLANLATSHNTKYAEAVNAVVEFEKASFAYLEGENREKLEPIIRDALTKIVPPVFQDSPLARPFVKAIFTIQQLGEQLKLAKQGKVETKVEEKVAETKNTKNPNLSDMSGGSSKASDTQEAPSIEALEEVLGRSWV